MKKTLAIIIAALMLLSVALLAVSCGSDDSKDSKETTASETEKKEEGKKEEEKKEENKTDDPGNTATETSSGFIGKWRTTEKLDLGKEAGAEAGVVIVEESIILDIRSESNVIITEVFDASEIRSAYIKLGADADYAKQLVDTMFETITASDSSITKRVEGDVVYVDISGNSVSGNKLYNANGELIATLSLEGDNLVVKPQGESVFDSEMSFKKIG